MRALAGECQGWHLSMDVSDKREILEQIDKAAESLGSAGTQLE